MSLEFLSIAGAAPRPDGTADAAAAGAAAAGRSLAGPPAARSPMERDALAAGATLQVRDGWSVAAAYGSAQREAGVCAATVGWADSSHLGKIELQGPAAELRRIAGIAGGGDLPAPGVATRAAGAWWCGVSPRRALVVCEPAVHARLRADLETAASAAAGAPASVVDVTTVHAGLTIAGPLAREVIARFCALDLRDTVTPIGGFRPGSVARAPGNVLREDRERFLVLFGWALGRYMWTVVADAATRLGGAPVGAGALAPLGAGAREVAPHA